MKPTATIEYDCIDMVTVTWNKISPECLISHYKLTVTYNNNEVPEYHNTTELTMNFPVTTGNIISVFVSAIDQNNIEGDPSDPVSVTVEGKDNYLL